MGKELGKIHTFRTNDEDKELHDFLENLPKMKKSKIIKNMLLFALEHMEETSGFFFASSTSKKLDERSVEKSHSMGSCNQQILIDSLEEIKQLLLENRSDIKELQKIQNKTNFNTTELDEQGQEKDDEQSMENQEIHDNTLSLLFSGFNQDYD